MKYYLLFISVLFTTISNAQVGVNTKTPQADLHVEGGLIIENEILLGGDSKTKGDSGNGGAFSDFIVSQGAGKTPIWGSTSSVNIPTLVYAGHSDVEQSIPANTSTIPIGYFIPTFVNTNVIFPKSSSNSPDNIDLFEILEDGYYLISYNAGTTVDVTGNDIGGTIYVRLKNFDGTIANSNTPVNSVGGKSNYVNLEYIAKLSKGDMISIYTFMTRDLKVYNKDFSITYLYQ